MGSSSLNQTSDYGIMDEEQEANPDHLDSVSSESDFSSVASSEEETTSGSSSSSSSDHQLAGGPLNDMSSLLQKLPIKRGLSKHYQGKSQSFTSLSKVRALEDLPKPENQYNKKLKSCKSYGGFLSSHNHKSSSSSHLPKAISTTSSTLRPISKKTSSSSSLARGPCSSVIAKRGPYNPPIPPSHRSTRSTSIYSGAPLFA